jgi:hypothetical protein
MHKNWQLSCIGLIINLQFLVALPYGPKKLDENRRLKFFTEPLLSFLSSHIFETLAPLHP